MLCDYMRIEFQKKQIICSDRKQIRGCLGWRAVEVEAESRERLQSGPRSPLGVIGTFMILREVMLLRCIHMSKAMK